MYNVNIIMSVYNGEKYLEEQVESIIRSTSSNWKLFIFDDGSTDSTYDIATDYAAKYKNKIYVSRNPYNMGSTVSFLYNLSKVSAKVSQDGRFNIVNSYKQKVKGPKLEGIKKFTSSATSFIRHP